MSTTRARDLAVLLILGCLQMPSAAAEDLSIERLYAAPELAGPRLRAVKIAPDGKRVVYLRAAADDIHRLDLWQYEPASGQASLLLDARRLAPQDAEAIPAEEAARRERQRISFLHGIVGYDYAQDGARLLVPAGGSLYVYEFAQPAPLALRELRLGGPGPTDAQFSQTGRYVSYVRGQDLYAYELATDQELRLSSDGGGLISNGSAEFIAQEEMGRSTGYWWSPDDRYVASARVDESPVADVERFEVNAGDVKVVHQRYPRAGTANAHVELYVVEVAGGARRKVDLGADPDVYLARVAWFPDGRHLLVQRQSRDQKRLDLLKVDAATGASRLLLSESSSRWVELHDDLTFLKRRGGFLWLSQRSGYPHLYRYDNDGRLLGQLTGGDWLVIGEPRAIAGIDEAAGLVYFTGSRDGYAERHLYAASLDERLPGPVRRLTFEPGWHEVVMSRDARLIVDQYSSTERPPAVALKDPAGNRLAWLAENGLDAAHPYAPYQLGRPRSEFGTLPAADGTPLNWVLMKPADFDPARRYPVVVSVYGGPHGQSVQNLWSVDYRELLVRHGFLVFALDNRGAGRQGMRADAALHRQMGSVETLDQLAGARFLRSLPYVDGGRIGVFGWSYGGYMALNLMLRSPGTFQAGVAGAPVTDFALYDTHYTERYMGTPTDNAAGYAASSVLGLAGNLAAPLLLMHGMADDNVLFSNSTRLMAEFQKRNVPFDLMVYPGQKHALLRHAEVGPHALGTVTRWLEAHLQPARATTP
jgi:dipeptidyl-peptidase-4